MILNNGLGVDGRATIPHALVTGVDGFLGRALARRLVAEGTKVAGLDREAEAKNLSGVDYVPVDILELGALARVVGRFAEDSGGAGIVFHLAGMAHVGECEQHPARAFQVNVAGTANLLEACRMTKVRRVVFPSTALVYGVPVRVPVEETDATAPVTMYGANKLAGEALLQGYAGAYGFDCTAARLGNVYGQTAAVDSVVSIILRQVRQAGPLKLQSLAPVRDFIFREDAAEGLIRLAARPFSPGWRAVNLSSGLATSIREMALAACRAAGRNAEILETDPTSGGGQGELVLSVSRLYNETGWRTIWSLEEGLRQTLRDMETEDR